MNKGKAEARAGRAFPSEGKEGVWTQGWNSKQFDDAGTREAKTGRRELVGSQVLEQLADQVTGLGASG